MKFLKGFALGFLGFLLFFSLVTFGPIYAFNSTFLNPVFIRSEIQKLDLSATAKEILSRQMPAEMKTYAPLIDTVIADLKPWINEQIAIATDSGYEYLLGKTAKLNIVLNLETAKKTIASTLNNTSVQLLPAELQKMTPADRSKFINDFVQGLPATYEINRETLGESTSGTLEQIRQVIGGFHTGYILLLVLIVVFTIGIVLVLRQIRGAARSLGIISLIAGVLGYLEFIIINSLASGPISSLGLPAFMRSWLTLVFHDSLSPLQIYSLILVVVGVVLLVVSLIYRAGKQKTPAAATAT